MTRHRFMLTGTVFLVLAGCAVAQAQTATVDIKSAFFVGGRAMPAGTYRIEQTGSGEVVLQGGATDSASVVMPVITVLGRLSSDKSPELVFDKVNGGLYLSEIWLPGRDGLLVLATKEAHEHQVLRADAQRLVGNDPLIRKELEDLFRSDAVVKPAFNAIRVTVNSGVITLRGTVAPVVRERALTLARSLQSTGDIRDELIAK